MIYSLLQIGAFVLTFEAAVFLGRGSLVMGDEEKPGLILDYDEHGNLISLEILDASTRVTETRKIEFQLAE